MKIFLIGDMRKALELRSSHLLVGSISDVIKHSNHLALKRLQTISMRKYEIFNMYIIHFFYYLDMLYS